MDSGTGKFKDTTKVDKMEFSFYIPDAHVRYLFLTSIMDENTQRSVPITSRYKVIFSCKNGKYFNVIENNIHITHSHGTIECVTIDDSNIDYWLSKMDSWGVIFKDIALDKQRRTDTLENRILLLEKGLESVCLFLDGLNIPRQDLKRNDYTIVDRIKIAIAFKE